MLDRKDIEYVNDGTWELLCFLSFILMFCGAIISILFTIVIIYEEVNNK